MVTKIAGFAAAAAAAAAVTVTVTTILALGHPPAEAFLVPSALGPAHTRPSEDQSSLATRSGGTDVGSRLSRLSVASSRAPEEGHDLLQDRPQCAHLYGYGDPDHVPSTLQNITAQRYLDVEAAKQRVSEQELLDKIEAFRASNGGTLDLFERIISEEPEMAIAAEFKRASPSKKDIAVGVNAGEQGLLYTSAGAAVLSVLTEPRWFKGSLEDMKEVRLATQGITTGKTGLRPAILRKDFIVDEYQLLEARANGADTVLLIVAILELDRLDRLIRASRDLGMEPLVEVNTEEEMRIALNAGARVVGVNNRNLHTFQLDLETTAKVSKVALEMGVPWQKQQQQRERIVLCALSGIKGPEDVKLFADVGASMVLVGETLMRADDPGETIRTLRGDEDPAKGSTKRIVKVCGVTSVEDAQVAAAAGANLIGVIFVEGSPRRVTISQAKEISVAVQAFGERKTPMKLEPPPKADFSRDWFQGWAKTLEAASRRTPLMVGVFQNRPTEEIREIAEEAGLDLVQLHGDEGIEACAECGVPALRVVHVPAAEERVSAKARAQVVLEQLPPNFAAGVMLDTSVRGTQGGTGVIFDHEVAKIVGESGIPLLVAGGLTADNVAACIAETGSFGVDVSSGVEASKGIKDHEAVRRFAREARKALAS